jgi:hypothetical protein
MRTRAWLVVGVLSLAGAAAVAACGSDGGGVGDAGTDSPFGGDGNEIPVDALEIDPTSATLTVKVGGPAATQAFVARARVGNGAPFQVPATFTVDTTVPGYIGAQTGVFTTNGQAGGVVNVTASYGGKTANAVLTIKLEGEELVGNLPPDPGSFFDPKTTTIVQNDPLRSPTLVYPVAETKFPQNLYRTMFNWRPAQNSIFMLEFASAQLTLKVYTDGVHAVCTKAGTGGSCWETIQKQWTMIAGSNAGKDVSLTIYGTTPQDKGTAWSSGPYTFSFSKSPVPGAIYYWSTTAKGVRRGTLHDPGPTNFLTPPEADGNCVACHTLSRNGKRLAADVGGENLWVVEVAKVVPPPRVFTNYQNKNIPSAWATFNPDTTRIVSAKGGVLRLLDGNSGAPIGGNNGVIAGPMAYGTMPDWAPDGKHLVFAETTGKGGDRKLTASSITWLSVSGDTFSGRQVILQSAGATDNYAYPMFDPTSSWIAVARGAGGTDNDPTSQILVARAQPASTAQPLVRANTLVNDKTVASGLQNTMPTWAPTTADGIEWVAFTSTRDYGTILAPGSTYGEKRDQLWIAAIDTSKLGQGDPSFPAFRVPFLELSEDAHRPFWAEDAFVPPPPMDGGVPDAGCVGQGQDCTMATCCVGLQCQPIGNTYVCAPPIN